MKQIIYLVSSKNKCIEVWKLFENGKIKLIQTVNTDNQSGQPIIILKKRKKLYIGVRPNHKILVYDILCNGTLKKIGELIIPYSVNYLSCDKTENFLFCSYYHAGCMSISLINQFSIPEKPIQIIDNIKGCHSANIDFLNKLIFVPALLSDRIYVYNLLTSKNKIISLNKLNSLKCGINSGPRHMDFHCNKQYAYSINEINGTVDVWKIYNNKIYNIQNIRVSRDMKKQYWCADIHLTTCGNYLYTSDRFNNTITAFKINNNSTLMFINEYITSEQPKSFCIDVKNQYIISCGQISSTITIHKINNQSGILDKLYTYQVGYEPTWVVICSIPL